jgi:hypothetical protein
MPETAEIQIVNTTVINIIQPITFQYRPIIAPRLKSDSNETSRKRMPDTHQRHSMAL